LNEFLSNCLPIQDCEERECQYQHTCKPSLQIKYLQHFFILQISTKQKRAKMKKKILAIIPSQINE